MYNFRQKYAIKATHNLHAVIQQSKPEEVYAWLNRKADPATIASPPWATYSGNAYHAFANVRHSDVNDRDIEILRLLGMTNADINAVTATMQTPLHAAAGVTKKYPASAQVVRALVARGANIHARDERQRTPLHVLCSDATSDEGVLGAVASVMLEHGARINDPMFGGTTPLMLAAHAGHADLYAFLAQKGANIHAKDMKGNRASDYARMAGHYALADHIKAREDATPETKPSFDSTIQPKVEWKKLGDEKIARTTIEDPIDYKLTEIFNFRSRTYTCITQNLYTKIEAVTVRTFDEVADTDLLEWARVALERKGGRVDNTHYGVKKGAAVKISKPKPRD